MKDELYWSVDIETDGPIPGENSMLSLGAVAVTLNGVEHAAFSINICCLLGANQDPRTMEFWADNQEAWEATLDNQHHPQDAMKAFVKFVEAQAKKDGRAPVFVAYPAGFDFMFVYWYMIKFAGRSPFSFSAIDMKTLAMEKLRCSYRGASKRNFPREWFPPSLKHTHIAIDDAREQAEIFIRMMSWEKA